MCVLDLVYLTPTSLQAHTYVHGMNIINIRANAGVRMHLRASKMTEPHVNWERGLSVTPGDAVGNIQVEGP